VIEAGVSSGPLERDLRIVRVAAKRRTATAGIATGCGIFAALALFHIVLGKLFVSSTASPN